MNMRDLAAMAGAIIAEMPPVKWVLRITWPVQNNSIQETFLEFDDEEKARAAYSVAEHFSGHYGPNGLYINRPTEKALHKTSGPELDEGTLIEEHKFSAAEIREL